MFKTPILFLIFRRPEITLRVFNEIRKQQPTQLFIAADGGRTPEEHEKCEQTRQGVLNMIDWDCEVKTLFREKNLGCRNSVSSAITWFFNHIEQGIILEEDCFPNHSFFSFCEELLEKYKDDTSIYSIVGTNFQDGVKRGEGDYYFSYLADCWGWATWARAWKHYDADMQEYNAFKKKNILQKIYANNDITAFWERTLDEVYYERLSSWASIWTYSVYNKQGLTIYPNNNLITNIGFDEESTHCADINSNLANRSSYELKILTHPRKIVNINADIYTYKNYMGIYPETNKKLPAWKYMLRHPLFLFRGKFWRDYLFSKH